MAVTPTRSKPRGKPARRPTAPTPGLLGTLFSAKPKGNGRPASKAAQSASRKNSRAPTPRPAAKQWTAVIGPSSIISAALVLALLVLWGTTTTLMLVLGDKQVPALISQSAEMQDSYEDRLNAFRAEIARYEQEARALQESRADIEARLAREPGSGPETPQSRAEFVALAGRMAEILKRQRDVEAKEASLNRLAALFEQQGPADRKAVLIAAPPPPGAPVPAPTFRPPRRPGGAQGSGAGGGATTAATPAADAPGQGGKPVPAGGRPNATGQTATGQNAPAAGPAAGQAGNAQPARPPTPPPTTNYAEDRLQNLGTTRGLSGPKPESTAPRFGSRSEPRSSSRPDGRDARRSDDSSIKLPTNQSEMVAALEKVETTLKAAELEQTRLAALMLRQIELQANGYRQALSDIGLSVDALAPLQARRDVNTGQVKSTLQPLAGVFGQKMEQITNNFLYVDRVRAGMQSLPFLKPTASTVRYASPFGFRIHPILGYRKLHAGLDMAAPIGTPVRAAGSGVVLSAGWGGGYGNLIQIDHGNGLTTRYAHLSQIDVITGQPISIGMNVGLIGSTGASTGPHLHFETRLKGSPVNPACFVLAGEKLTGASSSPINCEEKPFHSAEISAEEDDDESN